MKYLIASAAALLFSVSLNAMDFNLYTNHRAMRVDDILTVVIDENANAASQTSTSTGKTNSLTLGIGAGAGPVLKHIPAMSASGSVGVDYDGKGQTARQGNLTANISARVVQVLDNGNLVIEGSKVVEINEEKEIIKISGIVRPQDIEANNIVNSSNIADAQIAYSGKGDLQSAHRPGPIARFLNFIF